MQNLNIVVGIFLVILGFLVKAFPNLIAGYNTMPKREKAKVDIAGLSSLMRNMFVFIGILIVIAPMFFNWLGLKGFAEASVLIVIFGGILILFIKAQKYNNNSVTKLIKAKRVLTFIVIALATFGSLGMIIYGNLPSKIYLTENQLIISGMYSINISIDEIQHIEFVSKTPVDFKRTNGFHYGNTMKGNFRVSGFGQAKLYMQDYQKPFILVTYRNGHKALINYKNTKTTEEKFNGLTLEINR
jgi:hypothetical protein